MKILFISYAFPPIQTMAAYRNYLIARGLNNNGHKTTILSSSNKKYFPNQKEDLTGLNIEYLPTIDYRTFNSNDSVSGTSSKGNIFKQWTRKLKNSWPFSLFFDLGGIVFILSGIIKGYRIVKHNNYDIIISHFPQTSNLIIASWIKWLYPEIKWICDFHHIYIDKSVPNVIIPSFQEFWFKNLLKNCTHLITVSEGLINSLLFLNKSISEIELSFSTRQKSFLKNKYLDSFCISYCGSLYEEQEFKILINCLNSLIDKQLINPEKLKFVYAGANFTKWNQKLKNYKINPLIKNENLGLLSRERSIQTISQSNINLLLSWNTDSIQTIIPGKFYDYISVEKPILLLINGRIDNGWENKFSKLKPGLICYEEDPLNNIEEFLLEEYINWEQRKPTNIKYDQSSLEKYSIQNQIVKLENIIQEIT